MTKQEIYDIFSEFYKSPSKMRGLTNELLSKIEQEKREVVKEVLNDLKGLLEGYIHTNENISLYEYYCKKYGVEI